jgi:hypothetical protein
VCQSTNASLALLCLLLALLRLGSRREALDRHEAAVRHAAADMRDGVRGERAAFTPHRVIDSGAGRGMISTRYTRSIGERRGGRTQVSHRLAQPGHIDVYYGQGERPVRAYDS